MVHAYIPKTEGANASMGYIDSISEILFQKEQGEEKETRVLHMWMIQTQTRWPLIPVLGR